MRHLERSENGRPMKARVARGLAPLAPCTRLALHGGMGQRAAARCRNLDFSALQGGVVVLLLWTM